MLKNEADLSDNVKKNIHMVSYLTNFGHSSNEDFLVKFKFQKKIKSHPKICLAQLNLGFDSLVLVADMKKISRALVVNIVTSTFHRC